MSDASRGDSAVVGLRYVFTFKNGVEKEFPIRLDKKSLHLIQGEKNPPPEWAKLKNFKCPNCTFVETKQEFCPLAVNLALLIDYFKDKVSTEEVDLLIESEERKYQKHIALQDGLSSLIGIYMVTSGCPILEKLKPMVRHHLPFANVEETIYRVVTMYLMAQFFLQRRGKQPDWDLKHLAAIYSDVQKVNSNVGGKFRDIISKDASLNALIKLDCSAFYISFRLNTDIMDEIESDFSAYFK